MDPAAASTSGRATRVVVVESFWDPVPAPRVPTTWFNEQNFTVEQIADMETEVFVECEVPEDFSEDCMDVLPP